MEYLSWLFFCLSPFALFCSEDGNGLILCPVFIALGFVFKIIGDKPKTVSHTDSEGKNHNYKIKTYKNGDIKVVVDVESHKFWEWHYKTRIQGAFTEKDCDGLKALKDEEARSWATDMCRYHNAWVPPEAMQEQIAKANGVVTEKMIKDSNEKKDKIQVGKYLLMKELMKKHDTTRVSTGERRPYYSPKTRIKKDIDKIKASNDEYITEYWAYTKYKKSVREIWDGLSEEEKNQALRWVEEYERQLMNVAREYAEKKRNSDNIDMDF